MQQELTRDDVVELLELSQQGNNCVCPTDFIRNLANKINHTINLIQNLRSELNEETYKQHKVVQEEITEVRKNPQWEAQLMYKHRGFSVPRFENLGIFKQESQNEALDVAKKCADKFIKEIFDEKDIEMWEVKVRPYLK